MKPNQRLSGLFMIAFLVLPMAVYADAPISEAVELSAEQARAVSEIQSEARLAFAAVRSDHHRIRRALRRATYDNDPVQVEVLSAEVSRLEAAMSEMRAAEDAEISALLTPDQMPDYDAWLFERDAMVGSSRDAKLIPD